MTDIVIQAENLGKKYTIGHQTERAATWPCATSTQRRKDAETQSFPYSPFSTLHSPFSILYSPFSILHSPFSTGRGLDARGISSESRRGEFKPKYGIIETRTGIKRNA